jgi:hypothetical protein
VAALRQQYPGHPQLVPLMQQLRMAGIKAVAACRDIMADSTRRRVPPNFRCEQLIGGGAGGRTVRGSTPPRPRP